MRASRRLRTKKVARILVSAFLILLLLMPTMHPGIERVIEASSETQSNEVPPLLISIYKYKRNILPEYLWLKDTEWLVSVNYNHSWEDLTVLPRKAYTPLSSMPINYPVPPYEELTNIYSTAAADGRRIYLPTYSDKYRSYYADLLDYSLKDPRFMCAGLAYSAPYNWVEWGLANVSSDPTDYNVIDSSGRIISAHYWFLDHPSLAFIYRDLYYEWCMAHMAMGGVTFNQPEYPFNFEPFYQLFLRTYPSMSFMPRPETLIPYLMEKSPNLTAAKNVLPKDHPLRSKPLEVWRSAALLMLLHELYLPLLSESWMLDPEGMRDPLPLNWQKADIKLPVDDSLLLILSPNTIARPPGTEDLELSALTWENMNFTKFTNNPDYKIPWSAYLPIYNLYNTTASPINGHYHVYIWIDGPALVAPVYLSTDLSMFLPNGLNMRSVNPYVSYFFDLVSHDIYFLANDTIADLILSLNNTFPLPNYMPFALKNFFGFPMPSQEPGKYFHLNVDLSDPVNATKKLAFMVYFNPAESNLGLPAVLHVMVKGEDGSTYQKDIILSPDREIMTPQNYTYTDTENQTGTYYIKATGKTFSGEPVNASFNVSINIYTKVEVNVSFKLLGTVLNAKRYEVSVKYSMRNYLETRPTFDYYYDVGEIEDIGFPELEYISHGILGVRHKTYFEIVDYTNLTAPPVNISDWDTSIPNTLYLNRTMTTEMTGEIIVGGVSPFPNAALPYYIPNFPSPTLPPPIVVNATLFKRLTIPANTTIDPKPGLPVPPEYFGYMYWTYQRLKIYSDINYVSDIFTHPFWEISALLFPDQYNLNYTDYGSNVSRRFNGGINWWTYEYDKLINSVTSDFEQSAGLITFIPLLIRTVNIENKMKMNPISGSQLFTPTRLTANLNLSIYNRQPMTMVYSTSHNIAAIMAIISYGFKNSTTNPRTMAVVTQYPTFKRYKFNLPIPALRLPMNNYTFIDGSEYGWPDNDSYFDKNGSSMFVFPEKNFTVVGLGLPAQLLLYQTAPFGRIHPSIPLFVRMTTAWSDPYIIRGNTPYLPSSLDLVDGDVWPNFFWVPFGSGSTEIPLYFQTAFPINWSASNHYEKKGALELSIVPRRIAPGDTIRVKVTVLGCNASTVNLYYDWGSTGNLSSSAPDHIILTGVPGDYLSGTANITILSLSEIKKRLGNNTPPITSFSITATVPDCGLRKTSGVLLFINPGLTIIFHDYAPNQVIEDASNLGPLGFTPRMEKEQLAWNSSVFLWKAYVTLIDENGSRHNYNVTDNNTLYNGVSTVIDPSLEEGEYKVVLNLTYIAPTDPYLTESMSLRKDPELSLKEARNILLDLYRRSPESFRFVNVSLKIGTIYYDNNQTTTVRLLLPTYQSIMSISLLEAASGRRAKFKEGSVESGFLEFSSTFDAEIPPLTPSPNLISMLNLGENLSEIGVISSPTLWYIRMGDQQYKWYQYLMNKTGSNITYFGYSDGIIGLANATALENRILSILSSGITALKPGIQYNDTKGIYVMYMSLSTILLLGWLPASLLLPLSSYSIYTMLNALLYLSTITDPQYAVGHEDMIFPSESTRQAWESIGSPIMTAPNPAMTLLPSQLADSIRYLIGGETNITPFRFMYEMEILALTLLWTSPPFRSHTGYLCLNEKEMVENLLQEVALVENEYHKAVINYYTITIDSVLGRISSRAPSSLTLSDLTRLSTFFHKLYLETNKNMLRASGLADWPRGIKPRAYFSYMLGSIHNYAFDGVFRNTSEVWTNFIGEYGIERAIFLSEFHDAISQIRNPLLGTLYPLNTTPVVLSIFPTELRTARTPYLSLGLFINSRNLTDIFQCSDELPYLHIKETLHSLYPPSLNYAYFASLHKLSATQIALMLTLPSVLASVIEGNEGAEILGDLLAPTMPLSVVRPESEYSPFWYFEIGPTGVDEQVRDDLAYLKNWVGYMGSGAALGSPYPLFYMLVSNASRAVEVLDRLELELKYPVSQSSTYYILRGPDQLEVDILTYYALISNISRILNGIEYVLSVMTSNISLELLQTESGDGWYLLSAIMDHASGDSLLEAYTRWVETGLSRGIPYLYMIPLLGRIILAQYLHAAALYTVIYKPIADASSYVSSERLSLYRSLGLNKSQSPLLDMSGDPNLFSTISPIILIGETTRRNGNPASVVSVRPVWPGTERTLILAYQPWGSGESLNPYHEEGGRFEGIVRIGGFEGINIGFDRVGNRSLVKVENLTINDGEHLIFLTKVKDEFIPLLGSVSSIAKYASLIDIDLPSEVKMLSLIWYFGPHINITGVNTTITLGTGPYNGMIEIDLQMQHNETDNPLHQIMIYLVLNKSRLENLIMEQLGIPDLNLSLDKIVYIGPDYRSDMPRCPESVSLNGTEPFVLSDVSFQKGRIALSIYQSSSCNDKIVIIINTGQTPTIPATSITHSSSLEKITILNSTILLQGIPGNKVELQAAYNDGMTRINITVTGLSEAILIPASLGTPIEAYRSDLNLTYVPTYETVEINGTTYYKIILSSGVTTSILLEAPGGSNQTQGGSGTTTTMQTENTTQTYSTTATSQSTTPQTTGTTQQSTSVPQSQTASKTETTPQMLTSQGRHSKTIILAVLIIALLTAVLVYYIRRK